MWIMESNGQPVLIKGKEESYSYQLQVNGFNPFGVRVVGNAVRAPGGALKLIRP